jgi:hypothetical protein
MAGPDDNIGDAVKRPETRGDWHAVHVAYPCGRKGDAGRPYGQGLRDEFRLSAYTAALKKAGALVSGDRLKPSTSARIVKVRGNRTEVLDGPFADVKEQFGGYYVIEAGNLEAAVAWAEKCPGAGIGAIEVRPVWDATMPPQ